MHIYHVSVRLRTKFEQGWNFFHFSSLLDSYEDKLSKLSYDFSNHLSYPCRLKISFKSKSLSLVKCKSCSFLVNCQNCRTVKKYITIGSNDYSSVTIVISLCSRSLPSSQESKWGQPKDQCHNRSLAYWFVWQRTPWRMVSLCGSCRNKNADWEGNKLRLWCNLFRPVERCSS